MRCIWLDAISIHRINLSVRNSATNNAYFIYLFLSYINILGFRSFCNLPGKFIVVVLCISIWIPDCSLRLFLLWQWMSHFFFLDRTRHHLFYQRRRTLSTKYIFCAFNVNNNKTNKNILQTKNKEKKRMRENGKKVLWLYLACEQALVLSTSPFVFHVLYVAVENAFPTI